jgi:hypothetical protein
MAIKLLRDVYTGPDGKSWALGRVYSLPVLAVGLAFPDRRPGQGPHVQHDMPYSLHEVGLYLMELGGAVLLLVRGHNSIDEEPASAPSPPQVSPMRRPAPVCFKTTEDDRENCVNREVRDVPRPRSPRGLRMMEVRCAAPCGGPCGKHLAIPSRQRDEAPPAHQPRPVRLRRVPRPRGAPPNPGPASLPPIKEPTVNGQSIKPPEPPTDGKPDSDSEPIRELSKLPCPTRRGAGRVTPSRSTPTATATASPAASTSPPSR